MKILITGATGFIGAAVAKHLQALGHELTVCVRDVTYAHLQFPTAHIIRIDFSKATQADFWLEKLAGIDVVINCVGVLNKQQHLVHTEAPKALFLACQRAHIKLIIQLSALGVEQSQTSYATTKKAADDFLLSLNIPAVIIRPSLVYASGSYGGTSLFRALASLPYFIPVVGNGAQLFQPIALTELTQAIAHLIETPPEKTIILNAAGLEKISLTELLKNIRAWLGFKKAWIVRTPKIFIKLACQLGSFFGSPVINSTAYQMLSQDNIISDTEVQKFMQHTQCHLKPFKENLFTMPSYVQDRWHARLYFLRPLLRCGIGLTWIFSGIFSLFSCHTSVGFLQQLSISTKLSALMVGSASLLDIILGVGTLVNFHLKKISLIQIAVILFYTLFISIFLPMLWLDPFGAVLKNIVIIIATLILMAISESR